MKTSGYEIINQLIDYGNQRPVVESLFTTNKNQFIFEELEIEKLELIQLDFLHSDLRTGYQLTFKKCNFTSSFIVNQDHKRVSLHFQECTFEPSANFRSIDKLTFDSCCFQDSVDFQVRKSDVNHSISNFETKSNINIYNENKNTIILSNIISKAGAPLNINLYDYSFVEISKCEFSTIQIKNITDSTIATASLKVMSSSISALHFSNIQSIKVLALGNSNFDSISLNDYTFDQVEISNSKIANFYINADYIKTTNIEKSHFSKLFLTGILRRESSLTLSESYFNDLTFKRFINEGQLNLMNLNANKDQKITLSDSNLMKTTMFNCNFYECIFTFTNTKLNELFISSSSFPRDLIKDTPINEKILFYGQLQAVFEKHGNTRETLYYKAEELKAQLFKLRADKCNINDRIVLELNNLSNRFGQSWSRGLLFTLILGWLFFNLVILSDTNTHLTFTPNYTEDFFNSYLRFLNPLRSFDGDQIFDKVLLNKLSFAQNLLDLVGRIFVTYGYFQTIQAFRKFGKK